MLDQPVPNPLAKNPNVHTHKVFAAIGLILIGTIVAIAAIWYYVEGRNSSNPIDESETSTKISTSSTEKKTNWSSYKSDSGVSFNYPKDWVIKEIEKETDAFTQANLTSPLGFTMFFVTDIDGLGGGCGEGSPQLVDAFVYSIVPSGFNNSNGEKVNVIDWGISKGFLENKGSDYQRKEVILGDSGEFPKTGLNADSCLTTIDSEIGGLSFSLPNFRYGTAFHGYYPTDSSYQKLSATEYFELSEVKIAKEILKTVKYQSN